MLMAGAGRVAECGLKLAGGDVLVGVGGWLPHLLAGDLQFLKLMETQLPRPYNRNENRTNGIK